MAVAPAMIAVLLSNACLADSAYRLQHMLSDVAWTTVGVLLAVAIVSVSAPLLQYAMLFALVLLPPYSDMLLLRILPIPG